MAAGDLALRLLITGDALGAIAATGAFSAAVRAMTSGFRLGLQELSYGLQALSGTGGASLGIVTMGLENLGKAFLVVGAIGTVALTALAVVLGIAAAKMYGDFQQGLQRLVTGAGNTTDNMQKLGQAILGVSTSTGILTTGTDGLNAAMYLIDSSGQRGAQSIATLAAAAQGAQIEMANVVDVTTILTTLQTDFGLHTFTATQYMNGLITAVANGKISLEALSVAMSPILPIAHQMGISFQDVAAAMSVQTNAGMNARQSATGLQAVFVAMEKPTKAAEKAMESFGVNSVAVANEMKKSLPGAIQMLIDAALKAGPMGSVPFNRAMMEMIGGGTRTAKTITALTQNMKEWESLSGLITAKMHLSSTAVMGWDKAQQNWNITIGKGKAYLAAFMINLGSQVVPIFTKMIALLVPIVGGFLRWVSSSGILVNILQGLYVVLQTMVTAGSAVSIFLQHNAVAMAAFKAVMITLAFVIGTLMVGALYLWIAAAAVAAVENVIAFWPVYAIVLAIIAVITLVILAIQHWGQITKFVGGIFSWLGGVAHAAISSIGSAFSALGTKVQGIWQTIANSPVGKLIGHAIDGIKTAFLQAIGPLGDTVKTAILPAWNALKDAFQAFWQELQAFGSMIGSLLAPAWAQLKAGFAALVPAFQMVWPYVQQFAALLWDRLKPILIVIAGILGGSLALAIGTFLGFLRGAIGFLAAFLTGLIQLISGVIRIGAGVVQVFASLMGGLFNILRDIFTGNWGKIKQDAINAWNGIKAGLLNIVGGLWTALQGLWNMGVQSVINFVKGLVTGVIDWFKSLFNALVGHSIIPDMLNAMVRLFAQGLAHIIQNVLQFVGTTLANIGRLRDQVLSFIGNMVLQVIMKVGVWVLQMQAKMESLRSQMIAKAIALKDGIISTIQQLPGRLFSIFQSMGSGLLSLLQNIGGNLINAARNIGSNIANAIGNFLHFSKPKMGPLSDIDTWMPHMMDILSEGVIAGSPKLQMALSASLAPLAPSGSLLGRGNVNLLASRQQSPTVIYITPPDTYLDGQKVTKVIGPHLVKEVRIQGQVRGR